jgi:hypothetical protein
MTKDDSDPLLLGASKQQRPEVALFCTRPARLDVTTTCTPGFCGRRMLFPSWRWFSGAMERVHHSCGLLPSSLRSAYRPRVGEHMSYTLVIVAVM